MTTHAQANTNRKQGIASQVRMFFSASNLEAKTGASDIDRLVETIDWQEEVDGTLSARANYELIKDKYGLQNKTDREQDRRNYEDRRIQHAQQEVETQIKQYGVDTVERAVRFDMGPEKLLVRVRDILEHYPETLYHETLDHYRSLGHEPEPEEPETHTPDAGTGDATEEPDKPGLAKPQLWRFVETSIDIARDPGTSAFKQDQELKHPTLWEFAESQLMENQEDTQRDPQPTIATKLKNFLNRVTEPVHDGSGNPLPEEQRGNRSRSEDLGGLFGD